MPYCVSLYKIKNQTLLCNSDLQHGLEFDRNKEALTHRGKKLFNEFRNYINSNSFVGKDFLRNRWKYELTMYFKHETIEKHFTETSNKVELRINHVRINRS